jgi:hypothetical protein
MKQKHISATVKPVGAKWRVMYSTIFIVILAISMNLSLHYIPVLLLIDSFLDNGEDFNLNRNIFLSGNYAPIDDEMINVNLNIVSGQIPASLSGVFLRVGPNEIPSHGFKKGLHWFDGHGMIHSIRITNETAKYSNEYIPTSVYTIEKNLGSNFFFRLGEFGGILGLFKALVLAPFKVILSLGCSVMSVAFYYLCGYFSYALLALVYISHVEDRFLLTPLVSVSKHHHHHHQAVFYGRDSTH